jgi:hypothetical protein
VKGKCYRCVKAMYMGEEQVLQVCKGNIDG